MQPTTARVTQSLSTRHLNGEEMRHICSGGETQLLWTKQAPPSRPSVMYVCIYMYSYAGSKGYSSLPTYTHTTMYFLEYCVLYILQMSLDAACLLLDYVPA